MKKEQILSLIQPSGQLHLGNYLGAIRNWVLLQDQYRCIYGIANYHPMTIPYHPEKLKDDTLGMAIDLVSCGVKIENLFIQSFVPEHTELAWILGCVTSYGELTRQTQFKEKSKRLSSNYKNQIVSSGLFTYPVLQAADILIYKADFVPVGKDQEQHLELARNISSRFNSQFGLDFFPEPMPLFTETPKVMSLSDPLKKMSKSLPAKHWIGLFEGKEIIKKKINSAVTDLGTGTKMSSGVKNLFTLLEAFGGKDISENLKEELVNNKLKYKDLKQSVYERIVQTTTPFIEKRKELKADHHSLISSLKESSFQIRRKAKQTLSEVKEIVGLL